MNSNGRTKIKTYNGGIIDSHGNCTMQCYRNKKNYDINFEILPGNVEPILGVGTCIMNNFITINEYDINQINKDDNSLNIVEKYKDVFVGLGKIGRQCKI